MIMALCTLQGDPQPNSRRGIDAIKNLVHPIALGTHTCFHIAGDRPMKSRRDLLPEIGLRQKIPRQLLDRKLIVRHVVVKSIDHPVAIGPRRSKLIGLKSIRVCISRQVEPVPCPSFAKTWRRQESVNLGLIIPGFQKSLQIFRRRREPDQIQRKPSQKVSRRGPFREPKTLRLQSAKQICIHRIIHSRSILHLGNPPPNWSHPSPVFLVLRPGCDPLFQKLLLFPGECSFGIPGWHQLIRIIGMNPCNHFALVRLPRHHRLGKLPAFIGTLESIETQSPFTRLLIRPMAMKTVLRQNRTDLAIKIGRVFRSIEKPGQEEPQAWKNTTN